MSESLPELHCVIPSITHSRMIPKVYHPFYFSPQLLALLIDLVKDPAHAAPLAARRRHFVASAAPLVLAAVDTVLAPEYRYKAIMNLKPSCTSSIDTPPLNWKLSCRLYPTKLLYTMLSTTLRQSRNLTALRGSCRTSSQLLACSRALSTAQPKVLPTFSMEGKTCLVTGAARGLGYEFCRAFVES